MTTYKSCDNFYTNGDTSATKVTYHIKAPAGTTVVIDGAEGGDYTLDGGKEQDHTFKVPAGGKLHVSMGSPDITSPTGQVSIGEEHRERRRERR